MFWNFLRHLEIYIEIKNALDIIEDPSLETKEKIPNLEKISSDDGIGVLEAPRGILLHHYHYNENKDVDDVKLYIATEMNIPIINKLITDKAKTLYEKTGNISQVKEISQKILRAFDPCISCATH
jgi:coenzyme F420-reducing hydrogenase alpha subunit